MVGKLITPLVAIGVLLAISFLIMSAVKTKQIEFDDNFGIGNACNSTAQWNCSAGVNATATTMGALDDIPGWLPIIIITVIGALLIGLVAMFRGRK